MTVQDILMGSAIALLCLPPTSLLYVRFKYGSLEEWAQEYVRRQGRKS